MKQKANAIHRTALDRNYLTPKNSIFYPVFHAVFKGALMLLKYDRAFSKPIRVSLCAVFFLLSGCSTTHFKESADKEAYRVVAEKTPQVPGMSSKFTIDEIPKPNLEELPGVTEAFPFLGEAAQSEQGAHKVSLEKALDLAVKYNRDYQNQRESLYLSALSLTLDRHRYAPIFSGKVTGDYKSATKDVQALSPMARLFSETPGLLSQVGTLAGTPGALLQEYADLVTEYNSVTGAANTHTEIVDEHSVTGSTSTGVDLLLKGGGRIAVNFTTNFLRFLTGDSRVDASSALVGSFTQPLLRGSGRKVAAETLTQSERDLLYTLRDFVRFRQEFSVQICSAYYRVLQSRDTVRNAYRSYDAFKMNAERERAFAAEGKRTLADLGRLEQEELRAQDTWVSAIRSYKQGLDEFKITLGLPVDTALVLDDTEMEQLKTKGIQHPAVKPDDAVKVALVSRLDLYTQRDQFEDAQRKVKVAASALKPGLDLVVQGTIPSVPGNRYQNLDTDRSHWNAGLTFDAPFDRKSQRNAYRSALISVERARRAQELADDHVKLAVRDAARSLDETKTAYEIALKALEVSRRRVEEQDLRNELGQSTAKDRVDAQNDLTSAENNLTAALVNHTLARLTFWRDMGILFIKEDGRWEEVSDVAKP